MERPPSSNCLLSRIVDQTARTKRVKVEVLIPPAVEPDPPPMNIKKIMSRQAGTPKLNTSNVLKPAVRAEADAKKESIKTRAGLCPSSVPPTLTSKTPKTKVPNKSRITAVHTEIRVDSFHFFTNPNKFDWFVYNSFN